MPNGVDEWGKIMPLQEIAIASPDMRVDREAGVIRGVRILGPKSLNKRRYTPEAIQNAAGMYEGRMVNVNHASGPNVQRDVADRFGWFQGVRYSGGGLIGDLHYLKSHNLAERIAEAAERNPATFGMSHNADGRVVKRGSEYVVEEIVGVRSVDVVADPATTRSLFESQLQEQDMDPIAPAADVATPEPAPTADTFDMLVAKLREVYDGEGDSADKAKGMATVIKAFFKLEDALEKPAATPAEPTATAESATVAAMADGITKLTEAMSVLNEKLDSAIKAPIGRPRSTPLQESGAFKPPANATEFVARAFRKRR